MKKLLVTLLLGAALAVAALPVSAQGTDGTVTLTADGNAAAVSLALPQEAAQGVTALRLSFEVESSEPVEAEFVFDAAPRHGAAVSLRCSQRPSERLRGRP